MSILIKKTVIASLAALTLGIAAVSAASPAAAAGPAYYGHGGYHGGYHGGWHGGRGWGPAVGLGIIGGLAAGAIVASQAPYYGAPAYYDDGCIRYRPVYDQWGQYMGRRPVNVCE